VNNAKPLDQLHTIFMVYGSQAMLPTEEHYGSPRVLAYHPVEAEQARQVVIDLLKESREITIARSMKYQQTLRWYHAPRVHPQVFQVADLVLH
jgi:hypothetical protein